MNPVLKRLIKLPKLILPGEYYLIGGIAGGFMELFVSYLQA